MTGFCDDLRFSLVCRKIIDILEVFVCVETLRKLAGQEEIDYVFGLVNHRI